MSLQAFEVVVVEAPDGGFLDAAVHPLGLTVIRHDDPMFLPILLDRRYGETIRDMGRGEHASADGPTFRPWAVSPIRYLTAPCGSPDALRARIRNCRVARRLPWGEQRGKGGKPVRLDIHRVLPRP
jgi:hypothetical protein